MCDESHTWQRSDTYNVWRIAHDKDKGLLFTLKPEMKNFFCKKMEIVCEMKISKSSKKCHE